MLFQIKRAKMIEAEWKIPDVNLKYQDLPHKLQTESEHGRFHATGTVEGAGKMNSWALIDHARHIKPMSHLNL